MRVSHLLVIAAVALTGSTASAQPLSVAKLAKVETFALDNGLEVAVLRIDAAPVVTVQVWYHVGLEGRGA